jgi:hypothetical protein
VSLVGSTDSGKRAVNLNIRNNHEITLCCVSKEKSGEICDTATLKLICK